MNQPALFDVLALPLIEPERNNRSIEKHVPSSIVQPSVFAAATPDPAGQLPPGAIVRQVWPWIGSFQVVFPYWMVHHYEQPDVGKNINAYLKGEKTNPYIYCVAVPFGAYYADVHWFKATDLFDTGLRWKVPSWDDLESWAEQDGRKKGFFEHTYTDHNPKPPYPTRKPYTAEAELVAMLDSLPVSWHYGTATRDNLHELFPYPSKAEWRARVQNQNYTHWVQPTG